MESWLRDARRRKGRVLGPRGSSRIVEGIERGGLYVFEGDMILGDDASLSRDELVQALDSIRRSSAETIGAVGGPAPVRAAVEALRRAIEASEGPAPAVGLADPKRRWPGGVVVYEITFRSYADRIREAMALWTQGTNIEFRERTNETAWVEIRPGDYTRSHVGYLGTPQALEIHEGTSTIGNIAHELGHTLGLFHEQTRADRDRFIEVVWDNVYPEAKGQFEPSPEGEDIGAYDFDSIMHYPMVAFALDPRRPTLKPRRDGVSIGQRNGPSPGDLAAVNVLYPRQDI